MIHDLGKMWKEAVMTTTTSIIIIIIIMIIIIEGTEENHDNLCQNSQCDGQDSNPAPSTYKLRMLLYQPIL
jgi:hypothetical protein